MRKIVPVAFFLFFLLLTFVYCPALFDPVLVSRQLLLSVFVILLLIGILRQQDVQYCRDSIGLAFGGLIFFGMLSCIGAHIFSESVFSLNRQLLIFLFFLITTVSLRNGWLTLRNIVESMLAFGLAAISVTLCQLYIKSVSGVHLFRSVQEVYGTFANKNLLASVLFLCVPFFCMAWRFSRWHRTLALLALAFSSFILIIIRTRTVFIALGIYVAICLCFALQRRFKFRRKKLVTVAAISIAAAVTVLVALFSTSIKALSSSADISRQYFYRLFNTETLQTRIGLWEKSLSMIADHPIWGVGPGNWQVHFPQYGLGGLSWAGIENGVTTVQRPHNDFLWIFCESGVFAVICYVAIFFLAITQLIRLVKTTAEWKYVHLLAATCGYMVIAFFDFAFERIEHQVIMATLLAIVCFYANNTQLRIASMRVKITTVIIASASVIVGFLNFIGLVHANKANAAVQANNYTASIGHAANAQQYFCNVDPMSMPLTWYSGAALFKQEKFPESIVQLTEASKLTPFNVRVLHDLGSALEKTGQHRQAIDCYRRALRISPKFESARINLAAAYFNSGEFERAFSEMDKVSITSNDASYRAFLLPILQNKINSILQHAPAQVTSMWTTRIKTQEELLEVYFDSKKKNITFTSYILKFNSS